MKTNPLHIRIRIVLFGFIFLTNGGILFAEVQKSTNYFIYTPSDLDNRNDEHPMGILKCHDNRTGVVWQREIDVLAAGLWRNVPELVVDDTRGRLFAWASMKNGGPGWRIFDLETLKPIEPETPLRQLEGIEPRLKLAGEYLILFHHDSLYFSQAGQSRVLETTYIFSADNLALINKRQGASGRMADNIYVADDRDYYYAVSTWNDRSFPSILKYSLPELTVIDSVETRALFSYESKRVSVKDFRNNNTLFFSFDDSPQSISRGHFIVYNFDSHAIIGKSGEVALQPLYSAAISDEGKWIFYQDGVSDTLLIYNSTTGELVAAFSDIGPRALESRSYIENSTLYIVDKGYSCYKVIDATTGNIARVVPIREENNK